MDKDLVGSELFGTDSKNKYCVEVRAMGTRAGGSINGKRREYLCIQSHVEGLCTVDYVYFSTKKEAYDYFEKWKDFSIQCDYWLWAETKKDLVVEFDDQEHCRVILHKWDNFIDFEEDEQEEKNRTELPF